MDAQTGTGDGVRIRGHLAAVRTLLAWQRIAVGFCGAAAVANRVRAQPVAIDRAAAAGLVIAAALLVVVAAARLARMAAAPGSPTAAGRTRLTALQLGLLTVAAALLIVLAARLGG